MARGQLIDTDLQFNLSRSVPPVGVHLKLAADAYCTPVRLRGSAISSQPSSIGTARLCCGWFDFVPIATRLWHFYGRLEWGSWIRSRCVRPLQRSRVENHRTRSQLRSGELCSRTIPSTTSCRLCTRYLASQHGASLLGTICDVVRNPRCRSVFTWAGHRLLPCCASSQQALVDRLLARRGSNQRRYDQAAYGE